jgi:hypothetical protein
MVEPLTYFCTKDVVTSVCFYEPLKSGKSYLVVGTVGGSLSCWDLKFGNQLQVGYPIRIRVGIFKFRAIDIWLRIP